MRKNKPIFKDERTIAVENASYGLGYKIVVYALLLDVMYRSFKFGDASWDLMGIVIFSGMIITGYQMKHKILSLGWGKIAGLALSIAMVIGIMLAVLMKH